MGIQVESIKAGDGKHYPAKRQTVTVDYVGYLDKAGEKKFDSTFERGMLPCPSPWASTGALADSSCLFGAQLATMRVRPVGSRGVRWRPS